jgi:hypothetical protein
MDAPVGRHGLTGPDRTHFLRGVIADGEDEIEWWRVSGRELLPTLAPQMLGGKMIATEDLEGQGMHLPFRMAPSAEGLEATLAPIVQQCLGEAPSRIAGAQKQHVVAMVSHHEPAPEEVL